MKKYSFILFIALSYLGQTDLAMALDTTDDRTLYVSSIEFDDGANVDLQIYKGTWTSYVTTSADTPIPIYTNVYLCLAYAYFTTVGQQISASPTQCTNSLAEGMTWGEASSLWIRDVGLAEGATSGGYENVQHSGKQKKGECLAFAFMPNTGSPTPSFTLMSACVSTPPPTLVPCTLEISDIIFEEIMTTDLPKTVTQKVDLKTTCEAPITDATLQLQSLNMSNNSNYLDDAKQIRYDFKYGEQSLENQVDAPIDTSSGGSGPFPIDGVSIEINLAASDISPGVYTATDTIVYYVF